MKPDFSELEIQADINAEDQAEEATTFNSRKVSSQPSDPLISNLVERISEGDIDLRPVFQRGFVWDRAKASRLIESVLLRIPLPVIYLAEETDGSYSVIDGQQRLTSLHSFLTGKFPNGEDFRLGKMVCFSELSGKRFAELDTKVQRAIKNYPMRVITFSNDSDPELKFNVFERLNTGSVALNKQELRNCLYRGKYNELLKELATDADFKFLLGLKKAEIRMMDVELVLRFSAFFHATYLKYKSPMKVFLNEDMRKYQHISDEDVKDLKNAFKNAVSLVKSLLGDIADGGTVFKRFYPGTEDHKNGYWEKQQFNASLYDVLMWSLAMQDKNIVMHNLDAIREAYVDLMSSDRDFIEAIIRSTSSTSMVRKRFEKWNHRLNDILGNQVKQPRCFSRELKEAMFKENPTCSLCGQTISCLEDAAVDHIEQYWLGGQTIPQNARLAHRYCNCARPRLERPSPNTAVSE